MRGLWELPGTNSPMIDFVNCFLTLNRTFEPYAPQDSEEFLRILLDHLDTAIKLEFKQKKSFFSDVFMGKLDCELKCKVCGFLHQREEEFIDFSVHVPEQCEVARSTGDSREMMSEKDLLYYTQKTSSLKHRLKRLLLLDDKRIISLYDCLLAYFTPEDIDCSTNLFLCSNCNNKTKVNSRFTIKELPNFLILGLKRFKFNNANCIKISNHVQLTINLNLARFCNDAGVDAEYRLIAVIEHLGNIGGGHYIAYAKSSTGNWHQFNDLKTKRVNEKQVLNTKFYVAFYQRTFRNRVLRSTNAEDVFISREWGIKYETLASPGPLVLSEAVCVHGKVEINYNPALLIGISTATYTEIVEHFGTESAPLLSKEHCEQCQRFYNRSIEETILLDDCESDEITGKAIVSAEFYTAWQAFIEWNRTLDKFPALPGPITNSTLFENDNLKEGLVEDQDYSAISCCLWTALSEIYGFDRELFRENSDIYSNQITFGPVTFSQTTQNIILKSKTIQ